MDIVERIKDNFNRGYFCKSMSIPELETTFPAWTIKQEGWIGVAVPLKSYSPFSEQFSHVRIRSEKDVFIDGVKYDILMLTSTEMETRNAFASVCADFVAPGKAGELRSSLISDPTTWWRKWKSLIGNISSEKAAYDTLGELLTVERILENGRNPVWSGAEYATHDIETAGYSVEVKTTCQRYGYEVTISSVYQMIPTEDDPLYLSFIRVEPSLLGRSIDDVAEHLIQLGYDSISLENALNRKQLEKGRPARSAKYKVIEWKKYPVDESFPAITETSFKGDRLPQNIVKFTYTVDLSGITGENIL